MPHKPKANPTDKPSSFTLLLAVRDSQSTRGSARALLQALVYRADRSYICWPSYRQLAEDTMLDEATLKRAAKTLEDAGLIRRIIRRQRSNKFFVRYDRIVEQAEAKREARKVAKAEALRIALDEDDIDITTDPDDETDESDTDDALDSWCKKTHHA